MGPRFFVIAVLIAFCLSLQQKHHVVGFTRVLSCPITYTRQLIILLHPCPMPQHTHHSAGFLWFTDGLHPACHMSVDAFHRISISYCSHYRLLRIRWWPLPPLCIQYLPPYTSVHRPRFEAYQPSNIRFPAATIAPHSAATTVWRFYLLTSTEHIGKQFDSLSVDLTLT